jgi:hypothetical protein
MFARRDQALHDLTMQVVGHDNADDIDVGVFCNRLPGSVVALISKAPGGERAELRTDVANRDVPQVRQRGCVKRRRGSVSGRVRPARHASSDDCDTDRHDLSFSAVD